MKLENLAQSRAKATFTVTPEEFEQALNQAFEVVVKNVKVDGFRKGKCPRSLFEKMYGVEALFEEALNVVLNTKASELYKDETINSRILGQFTPEIGKNFARGTEFEVSLEFDVFPTCELPQYKGLEVKKQELTATEEEIDNAVKADLNQHGTLNVKAEQVVANGDTVKFDFEGSIDGVKFDGGSAENYELVIGSGQFIPGFEDQMVGLKANETKDINVTFPENYPATDLAGKAAVFKVTVHEVKENVLPELNDEFVKSLGIANVNTVEELKASKKANIEESKKISEKNRQVDELFNQILDNTKVELPKTLVEDSINRFKSQYEMQAKNYNIPFETFLSLMGTTKEQFEKDAAERANRQALFQVVLSEIIKAEKLDPTSEEFDAEVKKIAAQTKQSEAQIKRTRAAQIYSEITYSKAEELILSSAKEI